MTDLQMQRERSGPIRVLLVNDHLGWGRQIHGVTRLFGLWASHLDPGEFEVTVCVLRPRSALEQALTRHGVRVVFLGKSKYDPSTLFALLRLIRRLEVDVLHLQSYGGTTFGRLAALLTGTPALVHFHDTTPNYPFIQRLSDRVLRPCADVYLAVSSTVRDCWARRCGLPPSQVLVMRNCVDLSAFSGGKDGATEKARLGIPPDAPVIGTVTRLFEEKGTRYLIEALPAILAQAPRARCVIVGDGPLRQELQELAQARGVAAALVWTGFTDDVASVLGTFDIFALTSVFAEGGCPLPVIEAMALAKPVVVTDMVEIVEHDVNGRVVPARRADRLAEEIRALLARPDERLRLGEAGQVKSRSYDVRSYVRQLGQIYEALVAPR